MTDPVHARIEVVAVSAGACTGKPTWETATSLLRRQLQRRFGEAVAVEYIELFSPRSLELPEVLRGIGDESLRLPIVLINGQVVSTGAKLNEGFIARKIAEILQSTSPVYGLAQKSD